MPGRRYSYQRNLQCLSWRQLGFWQNESSLQWEDSSKGIKVRAVVMNQEKRTSKIVMNLTKWLWIKRLGQKQCESSHKNWYFMKITFVLKNLNCKLIKLQKLHSWVKCQLKMSLWLSKGLLLKSGTLDRKFPGKAAGSN